MSTMKIQGINDYLVDSMNYKEMRKSLWGAVRRTIKLIPDNQVQSFSYGSNRILKYSFPATGFLDLQNTPMIFTAKNTGDEGNSFNNVIECVINRVEVFTGDGITQMELLQNYNINSISKYKFETSQDYGDTIGATQQGYADLGTRQTWAQEGRQYSINMTGSGMLSNQMKYLPLGLMARCGGYSRAMVVEITLEMPEQCMTTDGVGTIRNYEITNPYFQLELLDMPAYEQKLYDQLVAGGNLTIPFVTSDLWTNTIQTGAMGESTFPMAEYKDYLQGIKTIFKKPNSDPTIDYTYTYTKPNGFNNYQYIIKDVVYPTLPLQMSQFENAAQFNEVLKYFNKTKTLSKSILGNQQGSGILLANQTTTGSLATLIQDDPDNDRFTYSLDVDEINQGWTFPTATTFTPPVAGNYLISATVTTTEWSTGGNATDIEYNVALRKDSDEAAVNVEAVMIQKRASIVAVTAAASNSIVSRTLTFIAFLTTDEAYKLQITFTEDATVFGRINIGSGKLSAALVSPSADSMTDNFKERDFMICQNLKTFYDCEDHYLESGQFVLDGIDTTNASQVTFRMQTNASNNTTLSLFHYFNFIGAVVLSHNRIKVIR